ncbi:MAG TPA: ABC transporter permease [Candidatus Acidoferrum sp.]
MRLEHWLYTIPLRLRSFFHRKRVELELDEELQYHLDRKTEEFLAQGMTPEDARRTAIRAMDGLELRKEQCRDVRGVNLVETLIQDIRYAVRVLRRTPVTTAVAIFSLALGIGANTAIFSLIDSVMLRMLPVQNPQELVQVRRENPRYPNNEPSGVFTNPLWEEMRDHQDLFSGMFAWESTPFDLAQGGAVQRANGMFVSGDYFKTLGVRPAAGRLFVKSDDQRGCAGAAVLSYEFWEEHFGGASSAIGDMISLDGHKFEIIGVSQPGFYGTHIEIKFDVAIPICAAAQFDGARSRLDARSWWWLNVIGRVKPGVTPQQLRARLGVLSPQVFSAVVPPNWEPKDQESFRKETLVATPAGTGVSYLLRQKFGQPLDILMGVVGLVLLIACANIASLMLARAAARHKEIAVRKALGASRARLIRQLLTECVLLSATGALFGMLLARWGSALLVRLISTRSNPLPLFLDLSLDWRVLSFTAAAAVLTGLMFGVLPAFRSTSVSLTSAMKGSQAADVGSHARFRPGKWIVASQVALSLVLLVASGLFLKSFAKLVTMDIGFDRNNVLLVQANLHTANVPTERQPAMFDDIERRLRALPGVVSASRSILTPVSNLTWNDVLQVDTPNPPTGDDALVNFNFISPGYFETLRTTLLAGRDFHASDTKTSAKVAIINEAVARKFFPNSNPLGKFFRIQPEPGQTALPIEVVGLVKDAKYDSLREDNSVTAYFPITQIPEHAEAQTFELRTAMHPSALISSVQDAVAQVSKAIPLGFGTLEQQVDDSLVQERSLATLSTFFGALALLLAMIGLYGALSYLVTLRQVEFGIRMALGAPQTSILGLVMRDVTLVLGGGVAAGVALSLATVGLLQKLLFGLAGRDSVTMLAAVGALSAVAFCAGYLPARRAMRVDPMVALRYE